MQKSTSLCNACTGYGCRLGDEQCLQLECGSGSSRQPAATAAGVFLKKAQSVSIDLRMHQFSCMSTLDYLAFALERPFVCVVCPLTVVACKSSSPGPSVAALVFTASFSHMHRMHKAATSAEILLRKSYLVGLVFTASFSHMHRMHRAATSAEILLRKSYLVT